MLGREWLSIEILSPLVARWAQKVRGLPGNHASTHIWKSCMLLQQYWARAPGLYRYVPVRELAQAYRQSAAGEAQVRALKSEFQPRGDADGALAWTKHALTGISCSCYSTCAKLKDSSHMGMLRALALTTHTHTIKNKHAQTILPFFTE